jgi:CheY-like chemotaxis protein
MEAKILLVDDEPLIRRSMEKTLFRAGYDVETAGDCTAGLRKFQAALASDEPFSLAVLDMNMPDFDGQEKPGAGMELLIRLRDLHPALPVIVLSAYDEVLRTKEAMQHGANGYCVKGREQSLLDTIAEILADHATSQGKA